MMRKSFMTSAILIDRASLTASFVSTMKLPSTRVDVQAELG